MSFRLEEKIKLHISDKIKLKNLITKNFGEELYPKRKISSIYFDNKYLDMYKDSEEGTLPRKKIRIRSYPEEKKDSKNLEVKITSAEGKFKKNRKLINEFSNDYLQKGIYDSTYGLCKKVIKISYDREYWLLNNARLTIDCNIKYESSINQMVYLDNETLILEIKSIKNIVSVQNSLLEILPLEKQRFSKYCEGVNKIFNQNHFQRMAI